MGVDRDLHQGLRYGLRRHQLGCHMVGLEFMVAAAARHSQLKIMRQICIKRNATAKLCQFMPQHGVGVDVDVDAVDA